jgi:hypothetical protein
MTNGMDFPCPFIFFSACCRPVTLVRGVLFVCTVCVWRCACLLALPKGGELVGCVRCGACLEGWLAGFKTMFV